MVFSAIAGFIFTILWLVWVFRRKAHQQAVFGTGILALAVTGVMPVIFINLLGVAQMLVWYSWAVFWYSIEIISILPGLLILIASRFIPTAK
jgi:hypothetical protein